MNRTVLGAFAALLLAAAGVFWWQGHAGPTVGEAPRLAQGSPPPPAADIPLPEADPGSKRGKPPPALSEQSKEEKRFNRYDRNRDGKISRAELLGSRVSAFKKLDVDGNNLLTFEEWAVTTSNRFKGADGNGDGLLTREEFATTRPKPKQPKPGCACSTSPRLSGEEGEQQ